METKTVQKTPSEWCKRGNPPIRFSMLFSYKQIVEDERTEEAFGEYASDVKKIIESNNFSQLNPNDPFHFGGNSPHYSIIPGNNGFCPFYDDKNNKCMLRHERPNNCL